FCIKGREAFCLPSDCRTRAFISRPILSPRERFTLPYPPPIHRDMTVRHRPILSTAMPTGALLSSRRCVPLSE
ncbi:hypothetical protein, partial [Geobacillus sp. PA-3]|uniref:hypothetical protein n=1 Tax=Geobacillus sp. PA-3 TaxID=1699078 RepID=UPI001ED9B49F